MPIRASVSAGRTCSASLKVASSPPEGRLLRRSRSDRMLGGVCGGLAHYFGVDPVLVRLIFVVIALIVGSGLLLYIVLWVLIPLEPADESLARR